MPRKVTFMLILATIDIIFFLYKQLAYFEDLF